jgi:hypothetical protein
MKNVVTEALDHLLSVFGKEAHFATVFMLENRYGIKANESTLNMIDLKRGLAELFGDSADMLIHRMEEYILQNSVAPKLKD